MEVQAVQWYRYIKDASEEERLNSNGSNINFIKSAINNTAITTSLTITNATESYTAYYWVRLSSDYEDDCKNISLTVAKSK